MKRIVAILVLIAIPALAMPPGAFNDLWAAAAPVSAGLSDTLFNDANCVAYWHSSYGVTLDGTNVTAWTDQKSGIIAAPTNASTTPWYDAAAYGGKGAVLFNGAQALNLNATLSSTNSTTIMAGWKPTGTAYCIAFGRYDSTGGPGTYPGNNTVYYHPDADDNGVSGSLNGSTLSNNIVMAFSHTGGNVTTNNSFIFQNGTNLVGVVALTAYGQAGPGPIYNRIGARQNNFMNGHLCIIAHFQPQLSNSTISNYIAIVKAAWGF